MAVNDVDLAVPRRSDRRAGRPQRGGEEHPLRGAVRAAARPSGDGCILDGEDVTHARPQLRAARGLARTFQHPELFSGLTVREHLVLAHRAKHARSAGLVRPVHHGQPAGRADADEKASVDELIGLLGLGPVADRSPLGLPLGSARLVELGRALAASPTVLLLDEPSSGLDSAETEQFEQSLRRVASEQGHLGAARRARRRPRDAHVQHASTSSTSAS